MEEAIVETPAAPETPAPAAPETPEAAAPAAAPATEKPDPKDRTAVIKAAAKDAAARREATNAAGRKIDPASGKYVPAKAPAAAPAALPAQAPTQAQLAAINAPGSLKAALKAQWGTLSREWQEELARIDSAAGKAAQPFQEKVRQLDELNAVIAPHLPMIQAEGGTPTKAIASLLQTAAALRTGTPQQKQFLLQQIARQYGVPMPEGQPAQPGQEGQQPQLPDLQSHPYVQQLAQTVQQLQGHLTQQQRNEQARLEEANAKAVQDFQAEKDGKGQPKYPLDESLEGPFAAEIQLTRGMHPDWDAKRVLEAAYENLTWKTPELRGLRLKREDEERRAKEAQELAAKKGAAVQVRGSGPAAAAPNSIDVKDRTAVIRSAMAGIQKRV